MNVIDLLESGIFFIINHESKYGFYYYDLCCNWCHSDEVIVENRRLEVIQ